MTQFLDAQEFQVSTSSQRPKLDPAPTGPGHGVDWRIKDRQPSYYYPAKARDHGLGGQRIALRVQEGDKDDVYWLHTDHPSPSLQDYSLGSTSLLSDESGDSEIGTTARFLPFGDYRTEPDSDLTDKGFTGHAPNDPLGLVDMRARYYVPSVGRFASADIIVPNPANPQSWNRFSYVNNNPLKYRDPSGHALECGLLGEDCGGESPHPLSLPQPLEIILPSEANVEYRPGYPPCPHGSDSREAFAWLLGLGELGMDGFESIVSIVGSEIHVTIGGALITIESEFGPVETSLAVLGTWFVGLGPDGAETVLGWLDLYVNAFGDMVEASTYPDTSTNELVIGQDTLITLLEQGVDGLFPGCPECDVVINAFATGYDLGNVFGLIPEFIEARLSPTIVWDNGHEKRILSTYLVIYEEPFSRLRQ